MNKLVDTTLKLLQETKVIVINNYDKQKCEMCKRQRHLGEFYPHELKRKTPVCKMCRQKNRLEKKYNSKT